VNKCVNKLRSPACGWCSRVVGCVSSMVLWLIGAGMAHQDHQLGGHRGKPRCVPQKRTMRRTTDGSHPRARPVSPPRRDHRPLLCETVCPPVVVGRAMVVVAGVLTQEQAARPQGRDRRPVMPSPGRLAVSRLRRPSRSRRVCRTEARPSPRPSGRGDRSRRRRRPPAGRSTHRSPPAFG